MYSEDIRGLWALVDVIWSCSEHTVTVASGQATGRHICMVFMPNWPTTQPCSHPHPEGLMTRPKARLHVKLIVKL